MNNALCSINLNGLGICFLLATAFACSRANVRDPQDPHAHQDKSEVFTLSKIGIEKVNGKSLAFRLYEGSAGTTVVVKYGSFVSPEKAKAQLRVWLKPAKRVTQDGLKKDQSDQVIGERVVAIFTSSSTQADYSAIFWTNGADLWMIQSSSLQAALQFEESITNGTDITQEKDPAQK